MTIFISFAALRPGDGERLTHQGKPRESIHAFDLI